jgi:hypothetical protein
MINMFQYIFLFSLNGVPEGVKQGGKLSLESRRIKARALPGDLPDILK